MLTFLVVALLLLLLAIGTPIGFALVVAGAVGLLAKGGVDMALGVLATSPASSVNSYEMVSVPMFMLMAEFVILSGIADQIFRAAASWVGRLPAGLAMATALAGAGFAAISGSSTAAAATLSSTTVPAMLKQGYEPRLALGVVAISGTLAMLIPPSIALILYGLIANVSIGKLLIGGVIPGIIVTAAIMLTVLFLVWRTPAAAPPGQAYPMREKLRALKGVGPMMLLFACVTGAIYTGVATPTEASALGALGALILAGTSGNLTLRTANRALVKATRSTCMVLMIILGAMIFGYFLALTQVTQSLVEWVKALALPAWVVITIVLLAKMSLGFVMDQAAIIVLTVPVVLPVVTAIGYDPIWFGVIMVVTAEVGMVTPPVGLNGYVVARYTGMPVGEVFRGVIPHVIAHVAVIVLMVAFPEIILWAPNRMH